MEKSAGGNRITMDFNKGREGRDYADGMLFFRNLFVGAKSFFSPLAFFLFSKHIGRKVLLKEQLNI